jgi:hypothetical protein
MKNKNVLLTATTRIVTLRLSQNTQTKHTQIRVLVCGYLFVLPQSSEVLETQKYAHVIIVSRRY